MVATVNTKHASGMYPHWHNFQLQRRGRCKLQQYHSSSQFVAMGHMTLWNRQTIVVSTWLQRDFTLSNVSFIILVSNGPHAIVFTVKPFWPSLTANTRLRWCNPAFDAEYAYVSSAGTPIPEMDPIWIIRGEDDFWSKGNNFWVNVNGRCKFSPNTRNQAESGYFMSFSNESCTYSSKGAPQLLPLLWTRTSRSK